MALEVPRGDNGGGYEFKILGDFEADAWDLFQRLYEKMRREMAVKHVERTEHGWQITSDDRLVGRIECNPATAGATPLLVADGRPFSWEEAGRMLMTYEGFTLHARIEDSIEVVDGPLAEEERRRRRRVTSGQSIATSSDSRSAS
jgi:hypothetical protein